MNKDNPIPWLALGLALGNKTLLASVLADLDKHAWERGPQLALWAALADGKDAVGQWLSGQGVVQVSSQTAAEAILAHMAGMGEKNWQRDLIVRLHSRAIVLAPDEFKVYLQSEIDARQVKEPEAAIAGKIASA